MWIRIDVFYNGLFDGEEARKFNVFYDGLFYWGKEGELRIKVNDHYYLEVDGMINNNRGDDDIVCVSYFVLTVCCLFVFFSFVLFCFVLLCFVSVDFFFCVASGKLFAVYVCLFFGIFFLLWQVARDTFCFYLLFVFVLVFCWRSVFGCFDIVFFFKFFLMDAILLQWQDYRACRPRNRRFGPLYRYINMGSGFESSGHTWSIIWQIFKLMSFNDTNNTMIKPRQQCCGDNPQTAGTPSHFFYYVCLCFVLLSQVNGRSTKASYPT